MALTNCGKVSLCPEKLFVGLGWVAQKGRCEKGSYKRGFINGGYTKGMLW